MRWIALATVMVTVLLGPIGANPAHALLAKNAKGGAPSSAIQLQLLDVHNVF